MKLLAGVVIATAGVVLLTGTPSVSAQGAKSKMTCVNKAGRGWGGSVEPARFQAWEAVLQDTDWGMWAVWMASGAKVGSAASGYRVRNMREKCGNDGASKVCTIRAKLCK